MTNTYVSEFMHQRYKLTDVHGASMIHSFLCIQTNMGIMTTVNPRLPQVVPKPMGDQGHNYNTFPVYVDPSYYSTFP